ALPTRNAIIGYECLQQRLCIFTARPCLAATIASLGNFRRINSEQANPLASEVQRVAVNDPRITIDDLRYAWRRSVAKNNNKTRVN
ncbi:MAG: hypothetical protein Q8L69_02210, partial [Gallionellaceae bacterium]|nr:hypothetical protein [Gallionellaceae bacterium]